MMVQTLCVLRQIRGNHRLFLVTTSTERGLRGYVALIHHIIPTIYSGSSPQQPLMVCEHSSEQPDGAAPEEEAAHEEGDHDHNGAVVSLQPVGCGIELPC